MRHREVFQLLILFLVFSATGCQIKKPVQEEVNKACFDSLYTENPSGILLANKYSCEEDGYTIDYPSNWFLYEYENTNGIDFFGHFKTPVENEDMSDLGIIVHEKDKSETLDTFCQGYITDLSGEELYSDVKIEEKTSFVYQDQYNVFTFLFTAKSFGTFDTRYHMFIEKGDKIYHLRGLLSPNYPTESLQLYFEIMTSIQFL